MLRVLVTPEGTADTVELKTSSGFSRLDKAALKTVAKSGREGMAKRINWMYLTGFGRRPTAKESKTAIAFLTAQAHDRKVSTEDAELWADFAHVLVNTKEFIFLR